MCDQLKPNYFNPNQRQSDFKKKILPIVCCKKDKAATRPVFEKRLNGNTARWLTNFPHNKITKIDKIFLV
jgi:hypothetical protein